MSYIESIVTVAATFSLLTLALNVQFGMGGLVNFGIVAFFEIGAYVYAIVTQPAPTSLDQYKFGLNASPWLAIVLAIGAAVAFAYLTSRVVLRLRTEYLALATFAFAEMLNSVLANTGALGNGQLGLSNINPPAASSLPARNYDLWFMVGTVVILLFVWWAVAKVERSSFGATLRAIRDDPIAAAAIGKKVEQFRVKAFLFGAAIASVAGMVYAWYTTTATPELFTSNVTFTAFIALVIGGVGSNTGAVLGAFILFGLQQLLKLLPTTANNAQLIDSLQLIPFGLILILMLRFRPSGLLGNRGTHGSPSAPSRWLSAASGLRRIRWTRP